MADSWVPLPSGSGFGLDNLPYGVADRDDPRLVVAVGDHALDLRAAVAAGLLGRANASAELSAPTLNPLMAAGPAVWAAVREEIGLLLSATDEPASGLLTERSACRHRRPFEVADYVDFYASEHHATNLGRLFRPNDEPLMPNWRHLPVGYHGRSSTVVVSGTPVRRPSGLTKPPDGPLRRRPSASLDVEVELGAVLGSAGLPGRPVPAREAGERIFGYVLLNDWSARDIQAFEYQPLGPHLGKSFATSVSPWVVPAAALQRFAVAGPAQDPEPDEFLRVPEPRGIDIRFELVLDSVAMAEAGAEPDIVSRPEFRHMYWSPAQMVAHVTSNGARTSVGDLYGSGTISGPDRSQFGSLIELTWRGQDPLRLPTGETRAWLNDGDTATIRGWCDDGTVKVDFGEVAGTIVAGD